MKDGFKDLLHFGVGSAMLARQVVEDFVDEMIRAGRVEVDERTQFVDDYSKRAEDLYTRLGEDFRTKMNQMAHEMNLVTREEFEDLKKEVTALQKKSASKSKPRSTAKKTTAAKKKTS